MGFFFAPFINIGSLAFFPEHCQQTFELLLHFRPQHLGFTERTFTVQPENSIDNIFSCPVELTVITFTGTCSAHDVYSTDMGCVVCIVTRNDAQWLTLLIDVCQTQIF